ncbi:dTMP kinase [Granulosicoccaceae sp. 1_MG-2023]|nr:dTMP kinase [Granulosicoccaceae sp. 1_MG-2023]
MAQRGKFITLEGGEGVGKTTNLAFIRQWLEARGTDLMLTREPGGTPLSEALRSLLLDNAYKGMDSTAELLMVFAARAEHLNKRILPALDAGQWVLCDRFTDASYAYQGHGRRMGRQRIAVLEKLVQGDLRPDLTLLLDVDPQTGLQRVDARAARDRFENEQLSFFQRVREGYLARAQAEPERFAVIDAAQPLAAVQKDIAAALEGLCGE